MAVGDAAANPVLTESCRSVAAAGDSLERGHEAVNRSSHLRPVAAHTAAPGRRS